MKIPAKIALLVIALSASHWKAVGSEILDVDLGSQRGFSLLVIECGSRMQYNIVQDGGVIDVRFPAGAASKIPRGKLESLRDGFISGVSRSADGIRINVKSAYRLRVYENRQPYCILLDFTHLPGAPVSSGAIVSEPKSDDAPPSSPPPVRDTRPADAVEEAPEDDVGNFQRGLSLKSKGDYRGALNAFLRALPENGLRARFEAAMMYEELNRRETAIEELKAVIAESSSWAEPRMKLGLLYKMSGRELDAETVWSRLFSELPRHIAVNQGGLEEQLTLAESLVESESGREIGSPPPIGAKNFPRLPWFWIIAVGGTAGMLIGARLLSNWRMNRLMDAISREEEPPLDYEEGVIASRPEDFSESAETLKTPKAEKGISTEDTKETASDSDELSAEKQKKIYELAEQNHSIAEIAKMLNMGQEEVKFILDFRRKKGFESTLYGNV